MLWKSVSKLSLLAAVVCFASGKARAMEDLLIKAESGDEFAMRELDCSYEKWKDSLKEVAISWHRRATNLGLSWAMCRLTFELEKLEGSRVEVIGWYRKGADLGNLSSIHDLWNMYIEGVGVLEDKVEAIFWSKETADAGNASAMCELGYDYTEGRGVPKNPAAAIGWYQKAAAAGGGYASFAMNRLGDIFENGKGVPQDLNLAIFWYRRAVEAGYTLANENLIRVNGMLLAQQ